MARRARSSAPSRTRRSSRGDLHYVNAHGTSTPLNDRSETEALKAALGEDAANSLPVSSTKSAIGHLLGAAGAVEAVATLLALRERIAPPTLGWEEQEEGLDLDYVPGGAQPLAGVNGRALALSNSFGFGGHNAVLCIGVMTVAPIRRDGSSRRSYERRRPGPARSAPRPARAALRPGHAAHDPHAP